MTTVFAILTFVVVAGNLLIRLVDRYFPVSTPANPVISSPSTDTIPPAVIAAIVAAVDITTNGKGTIASVEREDL